MLRIMSDDVQGIIFKWIFITAILAKTAFTQPDVIFTAEPCNENSRGSYAPVPNDPTHYKQCGPAGFFWILPCAPETFFSVDQQACVPKGAKTVDIHQGVNAGDPSPPQIVSYDQTRSAATQNRGDVDHSAFDKSSNFNSAFLSGSGLLPSRTFAPRTRPTTTTAIIPVTRKPPVRIVIENLKVTKPPPPTARDKQQFVEAPVEPETKKQQEELDDEEDQTRPTPVQSAPQMPQVPPPQYPYPFMQYPYPMMPYPPGGQYNQNGGPAPLPPQYFNQNGGPPLPQIPYQYFNQIPSPQTGADGSNAGGGPGPPPPHMPPPFMLIPPPPPPRPTAEPEPPRLVTLMHECVENGTCANDDESSLDVFCLHHNDPTRYYVCSPHPEMSGVWVEQLCPAGLHFSGQQCDRPARGSSTNSVTHDHKNSHNRTKTMPNPQTHVRPSAPRPDAHPHQSISAQLQPELSDPNGQMRYLQQMAQFAYQQAASLGSNPGQHPPFLQLPAGAEFVTEPNPTPAPTAPPNAGPWQYAIVNSAGVVQIQPAGFDNRLSGGGFVLLGNQQQSVAKPQWYVRQPTPNQPAPVPAPASMIAQSVKAPKPEEVNPTPPPPAAPAPLPNYFAQPKWYNNNNMLFPTTQSPPKWTVQYPTVIQRQNAMWQDNLQNQLQPPPLQSQQRVHLGIFPYVENNPKQADSSKSLTPDQLYAVHQQQQQLARGTLQVVPAIPGSKIATNQYVGQGQSVNNAQSLHGEYLYPYNRGQSVASSMADLRPSPIRDLSPTSAISQLFRLVPAPNGDQSPEVGQPAPESSRWLPVVGDRCSLLISPKLQIIPDPGSRRSFYMCVPPSSEDFSNGWTFEEGVWALMECPEDTIFNAALRLCDKPHLANKLASIVQSKRTRSRKRFKGRKNQ